MRTLFKDRSDAGAMLAELLVAYEGCSGAVVLGLPRGGVPVAFEVANRLRLPLDVFLVRKLGMPNQEELALGAIASGGAVLFNERLIADVPEETVDRILAAERAELDRREKLYRAKRPYPSINGKIVIVVDDGLATGMSMRAAISALRSFEPLRIVVGVPVGSKSTCETLMIEADEVVAAAMPKQFWNVGQWYADFSQTSDEEVIELLQKSAGGPLL